MSAKPLDLPKTKQIRPFQLEWVEFAVQNGWAFCWDEPGLGKTLQATVAAHNLVRDNSYGLPDAPILVVCPNSLKKWWKQEILALYPMYKDCIAVAGVGGRFRHYSQKVGNSELSPDLFAERHPNTVWYIMHYAGMRMVAHSLKKMPWSIVILDEAHYIKNRQTQRTKAIMEVTPAYAYRIGLTATPFGKNPADLWSQLRWMAPEVPMLKSYWRFFNHFVESEKDRNPYSGAVYRKIIGGKNLDVLAELMSSFGMQRSKAEVASQLPPITDTDMPVEMDARQEHIYEELRKKSKVEIVIKDSSTPPNQEPEITGMIITNAISRLTRMEQWLSCPWEFDPGMAGKGAKMDYLLEWAEGYQRQAVIATHFKSTATGIAKVLRDKLSKESVLITGDVPLQLRDKRLDEWREGKVQFVVGTIATVGEGLNLQQGHVMMCYDQVYDPIKMEQLRHRIHRLDSDHPVQIVNLFVPGTSNELILKAFKLKWDQMELVKAFLRYIRTGEVEDYYSREEVTNGQSTQV